MIVRDCAWVLLDEQPERGLGAALAWATRQSDVRSLAVIAEASTGILARRAALFEMPITVWQAQGRSLVPAHHEHQVAEVLETIEPWASDLARNGRRRGGRRAVIRLIGSALLVEHQVSGRFTIGEKPDLLWDRPDLERLYARLETDLIDTERSLRLEAVVVALILAELALGILEMVRG